MAMGYVPLLAPDGPGFPRSAGCRVRLEVSSNAMSGPPSQSTDSMAEPDPTRVQAVVDGVATVSEKLALTSDWRTTLAEVLGLLGAVMEARRILHFDVEPVEHARSLCSSSREWIPEGSDLRLGAHGWTRFEWSGDSGGWAGPFQSKKPICSQVADLPEAERAVFETEGVRSVLAHPIIVDGRVVGLLRFDFHAERPHLTSIEAGLVGTLGRQLAAAMVRSQTETASLQSGQMMAMQRMAGGVAHDFNNILTVLGGSLELSRLGLESGDPMRQTALSNLENADRAIAQGSDLLRRLSEFSQSREGRPETIRPEEFIQGMRSGLQQVVGQGIKVVLEPGVSTARIRIDPVRMEQMLMCLAVNARDSMPIGGSFRIKVSDAERASVDGVFEAERPDGWVSIFVDDDGTGMSKIVEERIFEPFFSTKPSGQGTGLGLVTVYTAVKGAGGRISVDSALGIGTTFRIDLPTAAASTGAEERYGEDFDAESSSHSRFGS